MLRTLAFVLAACGVANAAAGDLVSATPMRAPSTMHAWRVVYQTTERNGGMRLASGVVMAPLGTPPPAGRDIVAWNHPTTGISYPCGPSSSSLFFWTTPGINQMIARGYIVTATDYPGLGTPGIHPFLIGESEARSSIDIVRAARKIPGIAASDRYVAWGHSQGAQATLYVGAIAHAYAPELRLLGMVAAAPPTRLDANLRDIIGTEAGRLLATYALEAWSSLFSTPLAKVTNPLAIPVEDLVAGMCLEHLVGNGKIIADFVLTPRMILPSFWSSVPWTQLTAENSADPRGVRVPLLLLQGTADSIVVPATTAAFAKSACAAGAHVDFIWLAGGSHDDAGFDSEAPAGAWIARRFDSPGTTTRGCTTATIPAQALWSFFL